MKIIAYLALTGATEAMKVSAAWPNNETTVSKTCDGAFDRIFNEQSSQLYEKNSRGSKKYNDVSFPTTFDMVYWPETRETKYADRADWRESITSTNRPSEIDKNPSLWGTKGVRPDAVNQGKLGDCWFLSVLSAIGEWSDRTKLMFRNRNYTDRAALNGVFEVDLWMYGKKKKVVVDDRLLMSANHRPTMAERTPNGAWWVPIMEKATAKFFGNYEKLSGGNFEEAFYVLTGMPTLTVSHTKLNLEEAWTHIDYYNRANYVMSTYSYEEKSEFGIIKAHQYTTIGTNTYNGEKLVKLRNPWASERYTGPWSDSDTAKWTTDAKNWLGHDLDKWDGTFWMPFSDFHRIFRDTMVGMY
jgi:hypothetical protein